MDLDNVSFYNLGALEEIPGLGKNGLVRVPADVRNALNQRARFVGMDSVGIEIRFVTDAPTIDLYVAVQKPEFHVRGSIRIYKGNFQVQVIDIDPGMTHFHRITPPAQFRLANDALLNQGGFSPNVWRIVMDRTTAIIHGIHTHGHAIRPPHPEELPSLHWLAYGSSITNAHLDGYVHVAATKLRVQMQNLGFSGACQIEKVLVDYMLEQRQFDFITCELGVNMRSFSPDEFHRRAAYLIDQLVKLGKPALIITIFPNCQSANYTSQTSPVTENESAFNDILVKLVQEANCPTLQLMHGADVLTDMNGLSGDLIHPTVYGHAEMGRNLAERLRTFLGGCGMQI
jgi:lysophospholipase L1-like esterase